MQSVRSLLVTIEDRVFQIDRRGKSRRLSCAGANMQRDNERGGEKAPSEMTAPHAPDAHEETVWHR